MNTKITLDFDYTRNGVVEWAKGVAHDATDELRQLLADGVAGQVEASATPSVAAEDAVPAADGVQTSEQPAQQ